MTPRSSATSDSAGTSRANQSIVNIRGFEVEFDDTRVSAACATTRVRVHLSWNGGTSWTTSHDRDPGPGTNTTSGDYTLGSAIEHGRLDGPHLDRSRPVRLAVPGPADGHLRLRRPMPEIRVTSCRFG